jgi:hypothetical protein
MKIAEIIGNSSDAGNELQRPNYLSSVIQSHSTSVLTPSAMSGDNSIVFDLDQISKIFLIKRKETIFRKIG